LALQLRVSAMKSINMINL